MAMTTSSTFGQSTIHDPLRGPSPQQQAFDEASNRLVEKTQLLHEAVRKYLLNEITAEQLDTIKKTLSS